MSHAPGTIRLADLSFRDRDRVERQAKQNRIAIDAATILFELNAPTPIMRAVMTRAKPPQIVTPRRKEPSGRKSKVPHTAADGKALQEAELRRRRRNAKRLAQLPSIRATAGA